MRHDARALGVLELIALKAQVVPVGDGLVHAKEEGAVLGGDARDDGVGKPEVPLAREVEAGVHVDARVASAQDVLEGRVEGEEREAEQAGGHRELRGSDRSEREGQVIARDEGERDDDRGGERSDARGREGAPLREREAYPPREQEAPREAHVDLLAERELDAALAAEPGHEKEPRNEQDRERGERCGEWAHRAR